MAEDLVLDRKKVYICETYNSPLRLLEQKEEGSVKKYIFEGPCASFEGVNDNNRYYVKEEYLEHLTYLKEEIGLGLMGSLDHPEQYEVLMKHLSHIIKDIRFDEKTQQVIIKVELLNTHDGKDAQAVVEAGAPLYISSRASGYIDPDGKVTLERIYTYDIVYRPGFRQAKLNRLNESRDTTISSIGIYEWSNQINKSTLQTMAKIEKDSEVVTVGHLKSILEGFTQKVEKMVKEAKSEKPNLKIPSGKQTFNVNENQTIHVKENKDLVAYCENFFKSIQEHCNLMAGTINEMIDNHEKLPEHINKMVSITNENFQEMTKQINFVSQTVNENFEEIGTHVNEVATIVTENLNEISTAVNENFEEVSQTVNENFEEIGIHINKVATIVSENLDEVATTVNENFEEIGTHSNLIATSVNETIDKVTENGKTKVQKALEKLQSAPIAQKVDSVILESKKKKEEKEAAQLFEINNLDEKKKEIFENFDKSKKKRLGQMIKEGKSSEIAIDIISKEPQDVSCLLANMPADYKKVWESLSKTEREDVVKLYRSRQIFDDLRTTAFWESIELGHTIPVMESVKTVETPTYDGPADELGYSQEDIERLLN